MAFSVPSPVCNFNLRTSFSNLVFHAGLTLFPAPLTLLSLERLEHLGLFRMEFLNACRVTLEYTRAQANDELIQTLQDLEQEDTARFERMHDEWEKQLRDPDDVFFHAIERRQEIKEQIRDLQRALKRQYPRKNKRRARQKSRLR